MMLKPGAIAVLFLACTVTAEAWTPHPVETLYSTAIDLSPGTTTTQSSDHVDELTLLPDIPELQSRVRSHIETINERILVESVRQISIDDRARLSPEDEAHLIATLLRAVSSMEGIEYYSERRGRYRTLFERSTRIDDPDSRNAIADSRPDRVPDRETIHVLQEDGTFGENVYRFDYERAGDGMMLVMTNETRLSWGILPAVGANNLRLIFAAIPTDEGMLFYGLAGVEIPTILGMGDRVGVSFENRVNALSDWFEDELARALR